MVKAYKIDVDCANCANLMEQAAKKVPGVANVSISFMTLKMRVEFMDGYEPAQVMENILKVCRKVEPDCQIFF